MSRDWPEVISPGVSENLRGNCRGFIILSFCFSFVALPRPPLIPHTPWQRPLRITTGQHPRRAPAAQSRLAGFLPSEQVRAPT